jgi:hypothetical protein
MVVEFVTKRGGEEDELSSEQFFATTFAIGYLHTLQPHLNQQLNENGSVCLRMIPRATSFSSSILSHRISFEA